MLRRNATKTPTKKPKDPRAELVNALAEDGTAVASACGTCGATVATDDPEGVQTYAVRWVGNVKVQRRSWRYHRVCHLAAQRGPVLLALMLNPAERPIQVTQAHADVAERIGVPLRYEEIEGTKPSDAGTRYPFGRIGRGGRGELDERRAAVAQRHQELTVPVAHESGYPCAVCGRSHDLKDAWGMFEGRPVCGACHSMVKRSSPRMPGNRRLAEYAWDAMLAEGRHFLAPRADLNKFALAREMASYRPIGLEDRREPWAYVADLPERRLTDEERLAALLAEAESRLAGAAA